MNDSKISLGNEYKKTFFNEKFVVKVLDGNVNIILVRFREENISVSKQIIYPITMKNFHFEATLLFKTQNKNEIITIDLFSQV